MNNLPININSASAQLSPNKSSANDDSVQQDGQGFGNVLTRQVAESGKPAETSPHKSAEGAKHAAKKSTRHVDEQSKADTSSEADATRSLPADMLAALLSQQNQTAPIEQTLNAQTGLDTQLSQNQADLPAISSTEDMNTDPIATEVQLDAAAAAGAAGAVMQQGIAATGIHDKFSAKDTKTNIAGTNKNTAATTSAVTSGISQAADTAQAASSLAPSKVTMNVKENKGFAEALKGSVETKDISAPAGSTPLRGGLANELAATAQPSIAATHITGINTATSPISINTPVTQPAWGDELGQKITWMASQRNQSAELHLNPPHLGPLDVVLKINGDQATAMFTSPHALVRDAIEQAMPKLREMLADNGIMLGNASVSDQGTRSDQDNAPRASQGSKSSFENESETVLVKETRVSRTSRHNGMVDTFA